MTVLVTGLSHHTAAHPVLERLALTRSQAAALLGLLARSPAPAEAVVLATCNRVEIYLESDRPDHAADEAVRALAETTGAPAADVRPLLYTHRGPDAVAHLFHVVSGLDSMALGEPQIRGQVRAAYRLATDHGTAGAVLHDLFQHALHTGKRVETTTGVAHAAADLVGVALDAATDLLGPLSAHPTVIVGAGALGSLTVAALRRGADGGGAAAARPARADAAGGIVVVNRGREAAERLAGRYGVRAAGLDRLPALLARAGLVVAATGAGTPVITAELVAAARAGGPGHPLVLVDLSLPRNVEPAAARQPGVRLVDLAGLEARLKEASARVPVDEARRIVAEETAAFLTGRHLATVTPLIVAMRNNVLSIAEAEVDRLLGRTPALADHVRGEVARTARRIAEKIVHRPTVRVREMAAQPDGHAYVAVVHDLFGGPDQPAPPGPATGPAGRETP
ncbi:glutamyl-tRNA reductase [Streptomyces mobaraensis]|uniref:Glutamyl-tRNA reductase n=1 Tax=Streptomyces mobaraensis TaxID=35621 RepID=A0A5N5W9W4_STRMB|nr:glutamyl-tRNA reductase [Streptomyces mobaraensis]KAB7847299.1 glutamyl-tRNA reductase [Streptomyces mobaraensis]